MRSLAIPSCTFLLHLLHLPSIASGLNQTCTLCEGGTYPADEAARYKINNELVLNCSQMFDIAPTLTDEKDCEGIQSIGNIICQCNPEEKLPCTLCVHGSDLPDPDTEIYPGTTCADLEQRAANDFDSNCLAWQSTTGVYCNCPSNDGIEKHCHICPGKILPDPSKSVQFVDGTSKTCLELEVDINRSDGNCGEYQQLYAEACGCFDESPDDIGEDDGPTSSSTSMIGRSEFTTTRFVSTVVCVALGWYGW